MDSEAAPNEVPTEYSLVFYECYINTWFIGSSTLCAPLSFMPFRSARNKSQMASANCQENRKQLILLRLCPIESIPYQSMSSSTSCLVFVSRTDLGRVPQLFFVPFPLKTPPPAHSPRGFWYNVIRKSRDMQKRLEIQVWHAYDFFKAIVISCPPPWGGLIPSGWEPLP